MASPQLARVLDHLRGLAARPTVPGDTAAARLRVRDYNAVDPETSRAVTEVRSIDLAGLQAALRERQTA